MDRQWVVTAYTLTLGSLLLLGGRPADLLGRKTTFLVGLAGFAVVSAIGGASVSFAMLITARACQGAFAALLVPSAPALLTTDRRFHQIVNEEFEKALASELPSERSVPQATRSRHNLPDRRLGSAVVAAGLLGLAGGALLRRIAHR